MPLYEYYCRTCNQKFSHLRPLSAAAENGRCAQGHSAMKVVTMARMARGGAAADSEPFEASVGGGCACGRGSCGCGSLN